MQKLTPHLTPANLWGSVESLNKPSRWFCCPWIRQIKGREPVVELLSRVQLFATPWTAAGQTSLSFTISLSLLELMSFESVMPSNHLILCWPLLLLPSVFPSIRVFSNESVFHIRWPNFGASAAASVLPMNIQDWFPLGLTGLNSL